MSEHAATSSAQVEAESAVESVLSMGWAIPKRSNRTLTDAQKNFLDKLFDQGATTGAEVSADQALSLMKDQFDPEHFLPLSTIKNYFSRRAKLIREGKCKIGEENADVQNIDVAGTGAQEETEADSSDNSKDNSDDAREQQERGKLTSRILLQAESTPDLIKDDWIAVDMGSTWRPGQFVEFDPQQEEIVVNLLQRSPSNPKWFVWPLFQENGEEQKVSFPEDAIFFVLGQPFIGRRQTLHFDDYEDVDRVFRDIPR